MGLDGRHHAGRNGEGGAPAGRDEGNFFSAQTEDTSLESVKARVVPDPEIHRAAEIQRFVPHGGGLAGLTRSQIEVTHLHPRIGLGRLEGRGFLQVI